MRLRFSIRILFCAVWLLTAAGGVAWMFHYEHVPGNAGSAPQRWPSAVPFHLDSERTTLVLFAHPECPCTAATLEELDHVLARDRDKIAAFVVFLHTKKFADVWSQSNLRKKAAAIPGVTTLDDPDGRFAETFGARTSGHVVLYSASGNLLFSGGITESRGHIGRNSAEKALISRVEREQSSRVETPVYGCSLVDVVCRPAAQ